MSTDSVTPGWAEVGAEQLVEGLAVTLLLRKSLRLGKMFHPEQGTLVAKDGQDRHQQHPLLRVVNASTQAAIGTSLEEADQIVGGSTERELAGQISNGSSREECRKVSGKQQKARQNLSCGQRLTFFCELALD